MIQDLSYDRDCDPNTYYVLMGYLGDFYQMANNDSSGVHICTHQSTPNDKQFHVPTHVLAIVVHEDHISH